MKIYHQLKMSVSDVSHFPNFIDRDTSLTYLTLLNEELPWVKFAPSPKSRLVSQYVPSARANYDSIIKHLIKRLHLEKGVTKVEGVFFNKYHGGNDYCPYHKDTYGTDVWTISLGCTRRLLVKPDKAGETRKYDLRSGDLYFMSRNLQKTHKHSIGKTKKLSDDDIRISIVFFTHST